MFLFLPSFPVISSRTLSLSSQWRPTTMEAQDGEDPWRAETRPMTAEKKPQRAATRPTMVKASRENGWVRGQICFKWRIHRRSWRSLHVSEYNERTSLARFRRTSLGNLSGWVINPGFVENLALCRNPRIDNGGIGGPRVFMKLCWRRGVWDWG